MNGVTTEPTGAAWMYATTMVADWPGCSVNGPDDWKNRVSCAVWDSEQSRRSMGLGKVQGWSPWAGSMFPDR